MTSDKQVLGNYVSLLSSVDGYCTAPNVHHNDSCFHQQENTEKQRILSEIQQLRLPAELPDFVEDIQEAGEFIWLEPMIDDKFCTPETCLHKDADPLRFAAIAQRNGSWQMACVCADCGGKYHAVFTDWEAKQEREQQRQERRRRQAALNDWRYRTVTQTMLTNRPHRLVKSETLQILESVLVPTWDFTTMEHVIVGWQQAMRVEIAAELNTGSPESAKITHVFEESFGDLADKPTEETILRRFADLRDLLVPAQISLVAWLIYLTEIKRGNEVSGTVKS